MSGLAPITQALADAVTEAQAAADVRRRHGPAGADHGGLAPLGTRQGLFEALLGLPPTTLHVELVGGPAARGLYLALVVAGADVPTSVMHADVLMSTGRVDVACTGHEGEGVWCANVGAGCDMLSTPSARSWAWRQG